MTSRRLKQEGLKSTDWDEICRRLSHEPNRAELGMFGVMWSNTVAVAIRPHCGIPHGGLAFRSGPVNAGVVDLETATVSPSRSATTIRPPSNPFKALRQVLEDSSGHLHDGARPIALLNALRFGPSRIPPMWVWWRASLRELPITATALACRRWAVRWHLIPLFGNPSSMPWPSV